MREVTCHEVDARRLDEASEDIVGRAAGRWHGMRYDDPAPRRMAEAAAELLDHVAARTGRGAVLDEVARAALRTAAECRLGELSVGCFPDGDQEIPFPLIGEQLSTEDMSFGAAIGHPGAAAPSARTWLDAFAVCLVSGLVLDWQRVIGLLLRNDYAPAVHEGVPYSPLTSASDPADLVTMDALCLYLREAEGHLPRHWPTVPLRPSRTPTSGNGRPPHWTPRARRRPISDCCAYSSTTNSTRSKRRWRTGSTAIGRARGPIPRPAPYCRSTRSPWPRSRCRRTDGSSASAPAICRPNCWEPATRCAGRRRQDPTTWAPGKRSSLQGPAGRRHARPRS